MTKDDLIDRFGAFEIERLAKNINDQEAIDKAIIDATELVNGYIGTRYRLPVVLASVSRAIAVIARYYLYKDKPTDTVRQDYEDVLVWLKDVAAGKVSLPIEDSQDNSHFKTGAFVV